MLSSILHYLFKYPSLHFILATFFLSFIIGTGNRQRNSQKRTIYYETAKTSKFRIHICNLYARSYRRLFRDVFFSLPRPGICKLSDRESCSDGYVSLPGKSVPGIHIYPPHPCFHCRDCPDQSYEGQTSAANFPLEAADAFYRDPGYGTCRMDSIRFFQSCSHNAYLLRLFHPSGNFPESKRDYLRHHHVYGKSAKRCRFFISVFYHKRTSVSAAGNTYPCYHRNLSAWSRPRKYHHGYLAGAGHLVYTSSSSANLSRHVSEISV